MRVENSDPPSVAELVSPEAIISEILASHGVSVECVGLVIVLRDLKKRMTAKGGVCQTVWKSSGIQYRCNTCGISPLSAICVPCFRNGNHKDHDYSLTFAASGCCDCGNAKVMSRSGFCFKHQGTEQTQPLPPGFTNWSQPILDSLFQLWNDRLKSAQYRVVSAPVVVSGEVSEELTSVLLEVLLGVCQCSEGLLSFISERMSSLEGFLEILVRAERFICRDAVERLHELLLIMLGEPDFKSKFAKVFLDYYPTVVGEAIEKSSDDIYCEKYLLLRKFSPQIFTDHTLAPLLENKFHMLLDCLERIFRSCVGDDGRLKTVTLRGLYATIIRVVEDVQFVMSHSIAVTQEDITKWMKILSFVQGMDMQKREIEKHVEVEKEGQKPPFVLGDCLAQVHLCLVGCTTFRQEPEDLDSVRPAKIPRISSEISVSSLAGTSKVAERKHENVSSISPFVSGLTLECLRAIDSWLVLENSLGRLSSNIANLNSEAGGSSSGGIYTVTEHSAELESLKFICSPEWSSIAYDVSLQDVSVHIPQHRLLSMVLRRSLSISGQDTSAASEDFFSTILRVCSPNGFSAFIMEHPLRIQVFCAQVRASMWRKNGNEATDYCKWYQSVSWDENSLELDLFLLQCCASLAPPDLYVERILQRYDLSEYLNMNLEQSSEYESILVREMLTLIILIVKERRFCGRTTAESIRRELIYKLSAEDATYSQLIKSIPRVLSKQDDFQEILASVATFSPPSVVTQGMYGLQTKCWEELDLYHPRFSLKDLQKAEERYLNSRNISAVIAQPPKWTEIYQPLSGIARIATCRKTLEIVRTVLYYAAFSGESQSRAPEDVVRTALHLLSLALDICFQQLAPGQREVFTVLEFAREEISLNGHTNLSLVALLDFLMKPPEKAKTERFAEAMHTNLPSLCGNIMKRFAELEPSKLQTIAPDVVSKLSDSSMVASDSEKDKAKGREKQAAVLEKMKAEQAKFWESQQDDVTDVKDDVKDDVADVKNDVTDDVADVKDDVTGVKDSDSKLKEVECCYCLDKTKSQMCFLICLQKSRLLSFLDRGPVSWNSSSSSGKRPIEKLELEKQSSSFGESPIEELEEHSSLSGESPTEELEPQERTSQSEELEEYRVPIEELEPEERSSQSEEVEEHMAQSEVDRFSSDLKSEEALVKISSIEKLEEGMYTQCYGRDFSIPGGNQVRSSQSFLIEKYVASIEKEIYDCTPDHNKTRSSNRIGTHPYDGFGTQDCDGIHISSCGHAMHPSCLALYLSCLSDRVIAEGGLIENPAKGEFLCPMCRGIASSVLPTLPASSEKVPHPTLTTLDPGISSASSSTDVDSLRIQEAVCLMNQADSFVGNEKSLEAIPLQQFERQKSNLDPLFRDICSLYFPKEDKAFDSGRVSLPLLLWDLLRYSVASTEIAARSGKLFSVPTDGSVPTDLLKELKSNSGFILSLLLNTIQGSKMTDIPTALLRYRGIQLFAESLCLRPSNDERNRQEGNMLLLEKSNFKTQCPDIQFWKRASDPILARDSFSSLMWVFFCLPTSFLSCKESFLRLVHIFYLVTVTQAIVTCCRKRELGGLKDCLITDICKAIKDNEIPYQYFELNYDDSSYDIEEAIRGLSTPFLRRCSLLWGLANTCASFPVSHGNPVSYGSYVKHESKFVDIAEVRSLESMFEIPPLDKVINDGISREMATRWLHQFTKEFKPRGQNLKLYCTPSVPFSLVVLPDKSEDLFLRYDDQCCPDCQGIINGHALCLLCGKLCDSNSEPCCSENRSRSHANFCGAGTGVFLVIKASSISLRRAGRWAQWPSPYLDKHGEEDDTRWKRKKPLQMHADRYAFLSHIVASHNLSRFSNVHRKLNDSDL